MCSRVIRSLALAALLLPAAVLLTPARAQFGPAPGMGGMPPGPPGPMPPGIGGGMAGQPGGVGGGAMDEWVCSRCGAVIGHGSMKPAWMVCPRCGARFTDGPDDADPPAPNVPAGAPNVPAAGHKPSNADGSRTALIVVSVVVGVLVVIGAVGGAIYFAARRATGTAPRARRKRPLPRRPTRSEFPPEL